MNERCTSGIEDSRSSFRVRSLGVSVSASSDGQPPIQPRVKSRRTGFWVMAREAFWIAVEALRAHKLRSFLTLLGVVIATTTLIVVISVINGMNQYIADRIANLGANVFIVDRFNWANTSDEEWVREQRRNKPILMTDYEYLKDSLDGYKAIGASAGMRNNSPEIRYRNHSLYEVELSGQTPSMIGMEQEQMG